MLGSIFKAKGLDPATITYRTMRRMIGILGLSLPVVIGCWSVLLTGSHFLLDSISSYYHTNMRDIFVGILCAVSFFFFALHGYDLRDFVAYKISSVAALGVAFFPAFIKSATNPYIHIAPNVSAATQVVHRVSAAIFFVTLAYISAVLFRRTVEGGRGGMSPRKRIRNRVYLACGIVIIACVLLLLVVNLIPDTSPIMSIEPVFWLETIALFAFASSWLVKGEVLLKDK